MKRRVQFALVTGGMLFVAMLYACSDNDSGSGSGGGGGGPGPSNGNNNGNNNNGNNTMPGTSSGNPPSNQNNNNNNVSDASKDTSQPAPKTCDILTAGGPSLAPEACKDCAAQRCCTQITKCYTGAPAQPPAPGADGVKSACQLFGECEATCFATHGENGPGLPQCEFDCSQAYGAQAADDWAGSEGCIYGAEPAGCLKMCP